MAERTNITRNVGFGKIRKQARQPKHAVDFYSTHEIRRYTSHKRTPSPPHPPSSLCFSQRAIFRLPHSLFFRRFPHAQLALTVRNATAHAPTKIGAFFNIVNLKKSEKTDVEFNVLLVIVYQNTLALIRILEQLHNYLLLSNTSFSLQEKFSYLHM